MRLPHRPGRNADDGRIGRDGKDDDAACTDIGADAHLDIPEDLRARTDQDAAPYLRMAVAGLLARSAQRHVLENGDIILHDGGFTNDEAAAVIEHDAAPHRSGGVDV